jgi:hypothetical protein
MLPLEVRANAIQRLPPTAAMWKPVTAVVGHFPSFRLGFKVLRSGRWNYVVTPMMPRAASLDLIGKL